MRYFIGLLTLLPSPLLAANALTPGRVELRPTWSAVGLEVGYEGDDNGNGNAEFRWRKQGEPDWRNGVDMTIDRKRRLLWASIWPLEPGKAVEIEITFTDPDAPNRMPLREQCVTRTMLTEPAGGRTFFVSPSGNDTAAGTKEKPFRTLGHAARQARPGDIVLARSGVFAEGDLFRGLKGTEDRPIVFAAAPGEKPVLDSSTAIAAGSAAWKDVGGGVFESVASYPYISPGYLAQDGLRVFRYFSLADLKGDPAKTRRAWYHDEKSGKLYVRPGKGDADGHAYQLARHEYAVFLEGSKHVVVRGFEMRHYGNVAVRLSGGAQGCLILDNLIRNVPCGVFLKNETTCDNAIWRNEIHEPGLEDFSWGAIKGSEYARQGVFYSAGRGTSICYNRIHGWFDCVCPESWKNPDNLALNRDGDVMFNELFDAGDDAVEADGGGVNLRIHGNRIRNCLAALSLAPVERGPVYVTRNDATFRGLMFKLNVSGCSSLGQAYCYHNSGYCQATGADGGTLISFPPAIPCDNKVFKNNAMIGNEWSVRAGKPGYVLDGNCYWHVPGKPPRRFQWEKTAYPTIDAFRKATGQEQHGQYADPLFASTPDLGKLPSPRDFLASRLADHPLAADTKTGDLRLKPASPCIDRAVPIRGVNDTYQGKAPDIGAFEVR